MTNEEYGKNEIVLAAGLLRKYPDDEIQRDRLVYWLAYLKDFNEAEKYAVTQKQVDTINQFRNGR